MKVNGEIIKVTKLWMIKINTKSFRKGPLDGATFPYIVKVKYTVNNETYIKNKYVYVGNKKINIGDKVTVTYNESNPSKIVSLEF